MAFRIGAALAVAVLTCGSAFAANVSSFVSKEGKAVIILNGEIGAGDADQVRAAIKAANDAARSVSGIRLTSPGGNLYEGVKLADVIRFAKIATVVANGSTCASACFLAFAAGAEKYVSYSANVGVHGASENGRETARAGAATVTMAKIAKELGTPPAIIGKMVVTPPNQIVWLAPDDLRAMGATMTGKPSQTGPEPSLSQVSPVTPATSPSSPGSSTWGEMVQRAIRVSAAQNSGTADTGRVCQPEQKTCNTAVFFNNSAGERMMLKVTEDLSGKTVGRDVCKFNAFRDVRTCTEFDGGPVRKEMKNAAGQWYQVE
jgi:hypothetical protein